MVFTAAYGIGPITSMMGEPKRFTGSTAAAPASRLPA
jgi:hypothetical protein